MAGSTVLIRPPQSSVVPAAAAPRVQMLAMERAWADTMGSTINGFPVNAFLLTHANPDALKEALALALQSCPLFAGRWVASACCVALTNEGVSFSVASSDDQPTAPTRADMRALLRLCDVPSRHAIASGAMPLLTVKLTCFPDGTAVLGIDRSHSVCDGSTMWSFVSNWARAARGEQLVALLHDRAALHSLVISDPSEFQRVARARLGAPVSQRPMLVWLMRRILGLLDRCVLSTGWTLLAHEQLSLSLEQVARLRRAAAPGAACTSDGVISTQDALSAHMVAALARAAFTPDARGNVKLCFVYNARALLPELLDANAALGCGFLDFSVCIERAHTRAVAEMAAHIHEDLKREKARARETCALLLSGFEHGMGYEALFRLKSGVQQDGASIPCDLEVQINNQSKSELPDFGAEGGKVGRVLSENPFVWLPAPSGIDVHLFARPSPTGKRLEAALHALEAVPDETQQGAAN